MVRSASSLGNREAGLAAAVKKAVAELDPDQPVTGIMTMEQSLARSIGDSRFYAHLLEIFALIALLLAAIGIYGSMSSFVTERTHEIGIRAFSNRRMILKWVELRGPLSAVWKTAIAFPNQPNSKPTIPNQTN